MIRTQPMRTIAVPAALVLLLSCGRSGGSVPTFVERLPESGRASATHDSAMRAFARDLEAWSVRAGHPASAEALFGPLLLRVSDVHAAPSGTATGVDADYQRLEVRFAQLLHTRDSLRAAAYVARDSLMRYLDTHGQRAAGRTDSLLTPIFPPDPGDSTGVALRMGMKCSLIEVKVLQSKEGVEICWLAFKQCTRVPGSNFWNTSCAYACAKLIGWVPEGGDFSIDPP